MINSVPSYYNRFVCVADMCIDTCCVGWDVVVDDEKEEYYHTVSGKLGEKLESVLVTDADQDRIFKLYENKRCPFLTEQNLCELYLNLGKESLCSTCEMFPRYYEEFGNHCETGLGLGCPEVARLILSDTLPFRIVESKNGTDNKNDSDYISFLLNLRNHLLDILDAKLPLKTRIQKICEYMKIYCKPDETEEDLHFDDCLDVLSRMEYIHPESKDIFESLNNVSYRKDTIEIFESDFTKLLQYYIFRYLMKAVRDGDPTTKIKFGLFAVVILSRIYSRYDSISFDDRVRIMYLFSREIEYSQENIDELDDAMYYDFSMRDLINML